MFASDLQAVATASRTREKFRLAGGAQPLLLLPVRVNEAGPFEFILDTGAGTSILSPDLAGSLGIRSTGSKKGHTAGGAVEVSLARVDSLGVGAIRHENLEVAITDLRHLGRAVGAQVDGDLGYNFLKQFRLTIDFRVSELRLEDPTRCEYCGPPPFAQLPMQLAHPAKPLILVQAQVNGRGPFQFAIDTGTSTTAISAELARQLGLPARPIGIVTTGGAPVQMSATHIGTLSVGQAAMRDLDVIIGEFLEMLSQVLDRRLDGILGYNFLRHYKVAIDYPNESFRLFPA
jgi:predicted aspartyl protease